MAETTILDILDTAVKIGLGATIGGFTSYFLASKNHKLANEKDEKLDKRELIKSIAVNFEKSNFGTNSFAIKLREYFNSQADKVLENLLPTLSNHLLDAESHIESARANANLLGLNKLKDFLIEYSELLEKMLDEIETLSKTEEVFNKIHAHIVNGREIQGKIYFEITDSYSRLNT